MTFFVVKGIDVVGSDLYPSAYETPKTLTRQSFFTSSLLSLPEVRNAETSAKVVDASNWAILFGVIQSA